MRGGWDRHTGVPLALLADPDREAARIARRLLLARGFEMVHARAGIAALEIFQRLPDSFALALISRCLTDISGAVLLETLRLFRPTMPLLYVSGPIDDAAFAAQLDATLAGGEGPVSPATIAPDAIARAQARYALSGNMVEAAREIAQGETT